MDAKYRQLLVDHQPDIIKDLDVKYILDELLANDGIPFEEYNHIIDMSDRAKRTKYLLDILIQNGTNKTYQAFVDCLAKDHDWLWKKFTIDDNKAMIENSFEDSLSRGDVPRLPHHYVSRVLVEKEVTEKLKKLTRHKILALYGMIGCGKTVIAISVLRHNGDLITSNFNRVVFWLNLSTCKTEDDIIAQQNKLYRKASTMYPTQNSFMNSSISMSSIGSNADSLPINDWSWQELKDRLKLVFEEPILKEALLVLDEVNDTKCLEAFDIGCKILITTRDTDVVANFQPEIVKIENHFTEAESLELLSSCINVEVSDLPRQAKKLHSICKGSPYDMALLAAEFAENRERLIHDTSHWNYYIKKLEKRELFPLTRNPYKPMKTIEVCINSLKPDILPLFKMLTVLPDNVKFSARVLSKLWDKDVSKVEKIMKQLRSKSLIIESYDYDQRDYLYEIHSLIMSYLRTSSNVDNVKKLHLDFLKSYNYKCVADVPVDIEDDGYIAYYVGYHLLHTQNLNNAWSLFNKLFLNLKFIGNKVRLTGIADVKLDLQKYEEYIASSNYDRDLLYSLRSYLNRSGTDLHRYPGTDIVQSILQNERQGILYTAAIAVAHERCAKNELYFEFLHEQDEAELNQSVIDVKETITCVCFLANYVLVGTNNGIIKFFEIATNKLIKEISTGEAPVKWVGACPVEPLLVASLAGGVLRVWYLDDMETEDKDVIEEDVEELYNNNYPSNVTIQSSMGPIINCRWANNDEVLITHTAKSITVYGRDGNALQVLKNLYQEKDIVCCVPCNYDRHVIVGLKNSSHSLEVIDLKSKVRQTFGENGMVLNMLVVPGSNRILILKEKEVTEHVFQSSFHPGELRRDKNSSKSVITADTVKCDVSFLCMVVNKTGTLLFVATNDGRIICVDLKTYQYIFDLQNKRGNVVSMAISEVSVWDDFEPGSDVLLTGTGTIENSAKVWYLDASFIKQNTDKNGKVRLTTKFDASFINIASPNTPSPSSNGSQTTNNTPKRHQSFANKEVVKKVVRTTMSLDRHSLKPLNLKGICNGNADGQTQPLIAVVDERNNIQVMRGTKLLAQVTTNVDEIITAVKITPCNHYVIYGLHSGIVRKYSIRSKETIDVVDVYSPVEYLNFVNPNLLIVAGQNRCLMAYRTLDDEQWKPEMLQRGNNNLGSQELLNGIQGIKKKPNHIDYTSSSDSEASVTSKDRMFPSSDSRSLYKRSCLVNCYWIQDIGLITVESNGTVKLWDKDLTVSNVLSGRQMDVYINNSTLQKNVLVLCDDYNRSFQTYKILKRDTIELRLIQEVRLNNRIVSCALTEDANILAMGLDSGDVVIWNVPKKRQLMLLRHHKARVQWCGFSPAPARPADDAPLVLLTLAAELVWWDVSWLMRQRSKSGHLRTGLDAVTPMTSPIDPRHDLSNDNSPPVNFFFGDSISLHHCWKLSWRNKTYKEGSKRKEILSCIKLSGIYARQVCHDNKFACFVTVDNAGHAHVMSVMDA